MFTLSAALQESKNAVQQLQQQLSDQEAALAGSEKLREQLTQQVSSLEHELSDSQTAQHQATQVRTLLAKIATYNVAQTSLTYASGPKKVWSAVLGAASSQNL